MNAYTPGIDSEGYDVRLTRALISHLNSPLMALGPLLMTLSMVLALVSEIGEGTVNLILVPLTVSLGLIGGYLNLHSILVLFRTHDLILGRRPNTIRYIGVAVLYTATYYLLVGSFLTKRLVVDAWKDAARGQIGNHRCKAPGPLVILATLGAIVGFFARCVANKLALLLDSFIRDHIAAHEGPKGFSPEANQRE